MAETNEAKALYTPVLDGTLLELTTRQRAAVAYMQERAIIIDNASVFGIWVDGGDDEALERIITIKRRREEQRYATSVSAHEFVSRLDPDRINRAFWPLLDPDVLTSRLGALAFIRAPGRKNLVEDGELPERAVTPTDDGPVIQNWIPDGKEDVHQTLQLAQADTVTGVKIPVVTSLNYTGEQEITDPHKAAEFAAKHALKLVLGGVAVRPDSEGSFTIISLGNDTKIPIIRNGNIGHLLMKQLLYEYDLTVTPGMKTVKRPLTPLDHPTLQARRATLRSYILDHLGWSARERRIGAVASRHWPQVSQYNPQDSLELRAKGEGVAFSYN